MALRGCPLAGPVRLPGLRSEHPARPMEHPGGGTGVHGAAMGHPAPPDGAPRDREWAPRDVHGHPGAGRGGNGTAKTAIFGPKPQPERQRRPPGIGKQAVFAGKPFTGGVGKDAAPYQHRTRILRRGAGRRGRRWRKEGVAERGRKNFPCSRPLTDVALKCRKAPYPRATPAFKVPSDCPEATVFAENLLVGLRVSHAIGGDAFAGVGIHRLGHGLAWRGDIRVVLVFRTSVAKLAAISERDRAVVWRSSFMGFFWGDGWLLVDVAGVPSTETKSSSSIHGCKRSRGRVPPFAHSAQSSLSGQFCEAEGASLRMAAALAIGSIPTAAGLAGSKSPPLPVRGRGELGALKKDENKGRPTGMARPDYHRWRISASKPKHNTNANHQ